MSVPLPALKLIRAVSPARRGAFVVSLAPSPEGSTIVVSRFADAVWQFYPYMLQESRSLSHKAIDWQIRLPDGLLLTDPKHAELLFSAKAFVWSLFADPVEGRRRPTMSTLITRTKVLTFLLRWMVRHGLTAFTGLAGHTLAYAQATRTSNGKAVSLTTIQHRLQIVEDLFAQRGKLEDALQAHPWPGESIASLSGSRNDSRRYVPKTDPIPERVAGELARIAIEYIRERGSSILAARDEKEAAMEEKRRAGCGRDTLKAVRAQAVRKWGYDNAYKLTTDVGRLRMACFIVIALFSGMRLSEIMSLGEDCIARRPSCDGSCEVIWVHGTIYKTGVRPKAWQVPPVVEEAVSVLTRLTGSLRKALREEARDLRKRIPLAVGKGKAGLVQRMTIVERHQDKLFVSRFPMAKNVISVLSSASSHNELRRFCVDHDVRGDDGRPYPLHCHQFRRTYARFMAQAALGDLLTLRDHFGHRSLDMTVYYADGVSQEYEADQELLDMIATEKQLRQTEIVRGYLESDAPLANGGDWLGQWRTRVRTATSKEALMAEYAGSITLNGTGHSWCVGNARGTGCGGLCVFEAPMCVDCRYGIIGPEHRPVWEGIRDQQLEVLALNDVGESGRARARRILDAAQTVLKRLDGERTP
ncbi:MAG: tyrosine-type recombinase/integrase [Pseudomonadota bacterium]|jgi:integrase|nr:tyrosine-type recombinase/integrase [Pseudomonadota bacterium]